MSENNVSERGFGYRFGRAFGRTFLALFKTILVVLVIGGVAAAIYAGYLIATQGGRNQAWVNILRDGLDESRQQQQILREQLQTSQSQVATLEAQLAYMDGAMGTMESAMHDEMATMTEMMQQMDTQLSRMARFGQTVSETVTLLDEDLLTLQTDIAAEADSLGNLVSGLQTDTDSLRDDLTALQNEVQAIPELDVVRLEELLLLFRVGEMISRARLHLAEGNAGLALAQVNVSLDLVNGMMADERFDAAALTPLQERLRLAQAALPGDTLLAGRDLENGWAVLDARLNELLGLVLPEGAAATTLPTPAPTPLPPSTPEPITSPIPEPTPLPPPSEIPTTPDP